LLPSEYKNILSVLQEHQKERGLAQMLTEEPFGVVCMDLAGLRPLGPRLGASEKILVKIAIFLIKIKRLSIYEKRWHFQIYF